MKGSVMGSNHAWQLALARVTALSAIFVIFGWTGAVYAEDATMNPRYSIKKDGVLDKKTDLTWARCSIGQRWKGKLGCVGIVKSFTFQEAQQQGGKGWRVPTKDELASLIDYTRKGTAPAPIIDIVAFPDMYLLKYVYWSSTPIDAKEGWNVDFQEGSINNDPLVSTNALRLVRGGQ
jgi:hypothetical protein